VISRPRRLRGSLAMRELVAETHVSAANLMQPLFVREGLTEPREIAAMPGVYQHTEQSFLAELDRVLASGVRSVMLFAVPEQRDETGSQATGPDGILNRSVRAARARVGEKLVLVADLCLDEFTSHGHCGVLDADGRVDNDLTLERYADMALELARAGADVLGASGMMDGQVGHIRAALDRNGFQGVAILAYAAKYASSFYGPFRDAVESQLTGDRKTYQQDFRNRRESLREIRLDLEQGADIVMVKPALSYLDIISDAAAIAEVPVAAYIVSGEMAMIEASSAAGFLNREAAISEVLHSVRRAGAQIICTYWATEFAEKLGSNR
jgi:porphobilinogen synthase